jgi:hypothetical protein
MLPFPELAICSIVRTAYALFHTRWIKVKTMLQYLPYIVVMEVTMLLTERYEDRSAGILSCYDRVILQGTLHGWCYDKGMTEFLFTHKIRTFDYSQFAQTLRDMFRENAELQAPVLLGRPQLAGL